MQQMCINERKTCISLSVQYAASNLAEMQQKTTNTLKYVSRKEAISSTQIPTASECSERE
jgi:hypothetical protein